MLNYGLKNLALRSRGRNLDDVIFWVAVGVMAGGRIGYILFYEPSILVQPWQPIFGFLPFPPALMLWHGGMSFHGGLIGVTLAGYWFCRKNDLNPLSVGDLFATATPIGIFLVRVANFINGRTLWTTLGRAMGNGISDGPTWCCASSEPTLRGCT